MVEWRTILKLIRYIYTLFIFKDFLSHFDVSTLTSSCSLLNSLQALSGFLMMMTQNGKLLYISDNAAEYLGHSMVSQ